MCVRTRVRRGGGIEPTALNHVSIQLDVFVIILPLLVLYTSCKRLRSHTHGYEHASESGLRLRIPNMVLACVHALKGGGKGKEKKGLFFTAHIIHFLVRVECSSFAVVLSG